MNRHHLILYLILIPTIMLAQIATQPDGSGTSGDPYLISNINNLYWLTQQSSTVWGANLYFEQTADIDASASTGWWSNGSGGYYGFKPIGNSSSHFKGRYNGKGHTIDGVYINDAGLSYKGLFGYLFQATVLDLGVTNADVTGGTEAGVLAGHLYNSNISGCFATGTVAGSYATHGGLIGNFDSGSLSDCYSRVSVSGTTNIGGLIGSGTGGTISRCYSTGSVSGTSSGGLIGSLLSTTVADCFWDTESSGASNSAAGTGKSTTAMTDHTTFTAAGWDFVSETTNGTENIWDADQTNEVNDGYPILAWENGADQSLPVTLADFRASSDNGSVQLNWSTSSEVENLGFILERAIDSDGHYMEIASFKKHAALEGYGSTTSAHSYSFLDQGVDPGKKYMYRLSDVDYAGRVSSHPLVHVLVRQEESLSQPGDFYLQPAFPNPFNPATTISFYLENSTQVQLKVYDLKSGQLAELTNAYFSDGHHQIIWQAQDLSAGIYILEMQVGNQRDIQKITLIK